MKRVKSVSGYSMMCDTVLSCIPMDRLVRPGGLVLVWCTNSIRHRTNLTDCFSTWGVHLEATWYWVKLTRFGEFVTDFSSDCGKQPYEVILVARRQGGEGEVSQAAKIQIPDGLVIYSVPSGIHSHKPPLHDVLTRLVKPQRDIEEEKAQHGRRVIEELAKLEVFGRSLLPGWRTIGLQPCLFNITDNMSSEEDTITV